MSYWYEPKKTDLSISPDKKEIYVYLTSDDNGNVYAALKVEDIKRLLNKE